MYLLNNRRKWIVRRRPEGAEIPVGECEISVETPVQYTGVSLFPAVSVKYGGDTLVRDVDYALTYKDNVNPGNGTVTVTGLGAFSGSVVKTFAISGSGGGMSWDFNIGDATYVGAKMPGTSHQSTKIVGLARDENAAPGVISLGIANFISSNAICFVDIPKDDDGEFHVANLGSVRSVGVSPFSVASHYTTAKAVSPDGRSIAWVNVLDARSLATSTMSSFANAQAQAAGGASVQIETSVAHIDTSSANVAFIDGGRAVAVFCTRSGHGSVPYVVKFALETRYDVSTLSADSESTAEMTFRDSNNSPSGICVSEDGTCALLAIGSKVYQIRMSSAFNFSTASVVGTLSTGSRIPGGLAVSPDTKSLFFATSDGYVHEYALNR